MKATRRAASGVAGLTALLVAWSVGTASAEPKFLSKQYPRCTACHYSDSGGGLLTPYGRMLSRAELSTFGREGVGGPGRPEEGFLFGTLSHESPLQLGLDVRPSHVGVNVAGRTVAERTFLMNLDLQGAWRRDRLTAYATVGRAPERHHVEPGAAPRDAGFVSCEHWVAWQASDRVSVRGGRFLPAYGVRFADHTSFTRAHLEFAQDDQIYGVEVNVSTDRTLLQISAGPGRAESLIDDEEGSAFTSSARFQVDLSSRMVLAASALFRGVSEDPGPTGAEGPTGVGRTTGAGLSWGYALTSWLTTWTHADVQFQRVHDANRSYIVANQTSVEAFRGVWLRVSPQWRWTDDYPWGEMRRMVYGVDFFPRTHWHVNLSYFRDYLPFNTPSPRTLLLQLHLYL